MSEPITIVMGPDVIFEHITQAVALDRISFDPTYWVSCATCVNFHKKNPYIYFMAVNAMDRVVGYLNFSPLSEDIFSRISRGEQIDSSVTPDDIMVYTRGASYFGYLSSVVVHKDYRHQGIAMELIKSWSTFIQELKFNGITFRHIIADVVSPAGQLLALHIGFKVMWRTDHNSMIMSYTGM